MNGASNVSAFDRALAALARARGWVPDDALDRALAEGDGLGERLVQCGHLTRDQLASLMEAIGNPSPPTLPETRPPSRAPVPASAGLTLPVGTAPRPDGAAPLQFGPYRILREIGRGGMGVVYRALDPALGREVALKVLLGAEMAPDSAVERFRREASLLARVGRHPHLVQVHDVGREDGKLYFTMDFVEGRSLKDRIEKEGPLAPREAARIAAETASALEAAHRAGVVHRDVKPHNVLLDREGRAFLTDFGLARAGDAAGLTMTGDVLGSPAYMSPEMAAGQGRHAGPAADVWSLGATLFEALTGRTPFDAPAVNEILRGIIESDAPSPRSLCPGLHPDLDTICLAALRRDPSRRYPSAAAFEAELRRFLDGQPVRARPVSTLERLGARARRHRALLLAAAAAIGVVGGIAGRAWWRDRKDREEAEGRQESSRKAVELRERGRARFPGVEVAIAELDVTAADLLAREAVRDLEEALALAPEDAETEWLLGRLLSLAGHPDEAEPHLRRAVELNARHALAWYDLGGIALLRLREARGDMMRAAFRLPSAQVFGGGSSTISVQYDFERNLDPSLAPLTAEVSRCFREAVALDVSPDQAAFGRGMLASFAGDHARAIREFDRAIEINPFHVDAVIGRAESKDLGAGTREGGLEDWRRLTELRPRLLSSWQALAFAYARCGRFEETRELAVKIERECRENAEQLVVAAILYFVCADFVSARRLGGVLAAAGGAPERAASLAANLAIQSSIAMNDGASARKAFDTFGARLPKNERLVRLADILHFERNWKECAAALRSVPRDSAAWRLGNDTAATAEWSCGNLLTGMGCLPPEDVGAYAPGSRWIRGLILMDMHRLDEAIAAFESVQAALPSFALNSVHLAGARFLKGDTTGACDALQKALDSTEMPDGTRKSAENLLSNLRKNLAAAKTARERGKLVEGLGAALLFLAGSLPDSSVSRRSVKFAVNGVLALLQEYYYREGLFAESIEAGRRLIASDPSGGAWFKDARARAAAGGKQSAVESLAKAVEMGFDEGRRMDEERVFEAVKAEARYGELRARCR